MNQLPLFREPPLKPPNAPDISERTIRRWTLSGKLPATKYGAQCKIALTGLERSRRRRRKPPINENATGGPSPEHSISSLE